MRDCFVTSRRLLLVIVYTDNGPHESYLLYILPNTSLMTQCKSLQKITSCDVSQLSFPVEIVYGVFYYDVFTTPSLDHATKRMQSVFCGPQLLKRCTCYSSNSELMVRSAGLSLMNNYCYSFFCSRSATWKLFLICYLIVLFRLCVISFLMVVPHCSNCTSIPIRFTHFLRSNLIY